MIQYLVLITEQVFQFCFILLEKIAKEKIPVKDFTVAFTTCEETTLFGSKHLGLNGEIKEWIYI